MAVEKEVLRSFGIFSTITNSLVNPESYDKDYVSIWLKPTHILARQFKATELQTLKVLLREGLINYEICFLNIGYEGESQMFGFN